MWLLWLWCVLVRARRLGAWKAATSRQPDACEMQQRCAGGYSRGVVRDTPSQTAEPQPRYSRAIAEPQPRYSRATAELQPRYSRATAELQPSYSRATAEIQPSHSRATAELQPSYSRSAAELQPSYSRETAEPQPSYSRDTAEIYGREATPAGSSMSRRANLACGVGGSSQSVSQWYTRPYTDDGAHALAEHTWRCTRGGVRDLG